MDFRAPLQLGRHLADQKHCPPNSSSSSFQSLQLPAELSASAKNPRLLSFTLFRRAEYETATPPCRRLICRLESSSQEAKLHTSSSSLSRVSSHTSSPPPPPPTRLSSWSSIPWVQSRTILRLDFYPGSSTRNTGDIAAP
ncbi:hypothetical protein M747DRAFT_7943 [Aspergillus niger ATCC 13496]|uniref:Uncharacterized protein n=1 Tax=Aspergillus niger ATCC 13496 TaxID=1353008 RepID=A0A370CHL3_ASPNG|nr:hypothetical protein M747DRAFT_7943 [Aspergillus niger ATCC 13496]